MTSPLTPQLVSGSKAPQDVVATSAAVQSASLQSASLIASIAKHAQRVATQTNQAMTCQ